MNKTIKKIIGAAALFIIWSIAALIVNDEIILPSFITVIKRLGEMITNGIIITPTLITTYRLVIGVSISLLMAIITAYASYKLRLEDYLMPFISLLRTIPVISTVLIVLFFTNKNTLSIIVIFFVSFPIIYENVLTGLKEIQKQKLEMAKIYRISAAQKFKYIELPAIIKSTLLALAISFGLSFKAGSTAEVIAGAAGGLGDILYMAKISFEMTDLIAITFVIIFCSFVFETITKYLYKKLGEKYD